MSPAIRLGKTDEEKRVFLHKAGVMDVKTVSFATRSDWDDKDVEIARMFLKEHGIRIGEFSQFHKSLGSADSEDNRSAILHYYRQFRHAGILNAHCVGFSLTGDRLSPQMWSKETWLRCISSVKELAREAETVKIDIAAHPHIISPLCSVERYKELIESVASPNLKILIDPVNLIEPHSYFKTTEVVNHIFDELGDYITALHAKDVTMSSVKRNGKHLSVVHLDESVPGYGTMDYETILRRLDGLNRDIPVWVEHFSEEETIVGQEYIKHIARKIGIPIG